MADVALTVFIPKITAPEQLAKLLKLICAHPDLIPVKYGDHEPLRTRFDRQKIDEIAVRMFPGTNFFWSTRTKAGRGTLYLRNGRGKATCTLKLNNDSSEVGAVASTVALLREIVELSDMTFGFMHYLTDGEVSQMTGTDSISGYLSGPLFLSVTRWQLVRCLPELYWANVFGPEYTEMFGRDRVLSAPAAIVKELCENTFYIQLSENIFDLETRHDEIQQIRQRVKEHLGIDCFFDHSSGFEKKYRVPDTGWTEPPDPP